MEPLQHEHQGCRLSEIPGIRWAAHPMRPFGSGACKLIAQIIPSLRPPLSSKALPKQLLSDFFTIRSVDADERPVRLCVVHRAAESHPQSLPASRSRSLLTLAISARFRSFNHFACDPISGVSMPLTNGTPFASRRHIPPVAFDHANPSRVRRCLRRGVQSANLLDARALEYPLD